jgi:hypothetical protein
MSKTIGNKFFNHKKSYIGIIQLKQTGVATTNSNPQKNMFGETEK